MPSPTVSNVSNTDFPQRGNPLRQLADPTNIHRTTTAGLVINGSYHMDGQIRPIAEKSKAPTQAADPLVQGVASLLRRGNTRVPPRNPVSGLKIPGARTPSPTGWVSPPASKSSA